MEELENKEEAEVPAPKLLALQNLSRRIRKDHRVKIDIGKTEYPLLKTVAIQ